MSRTNSPLVTGIAPIEGPPGTLITLRGEYLGVDDRDVISILICGVETILTAEWISNSKITVLSSIGTGTHPIIVTTTKGGVGTSTVAFRGYTLTNVAPTQDSAIFVDETKTFLTAWDNRRPVQDDETWMNDNLLGLSDESNVKKFPKTRLHDMFLDGSGDVSMPNFNPAWYLLENHQGSSFNDLCAGLNHMKSRDTRHSEEPIAFVKKNLATFMECQNALVTMHNKLTWDENQKVMSLDKLTMLLQAADKDSDSLFHDILSRKEKADATRNALSILGRFKFLFYLPPTIRMNIAKGDYDVVINDYTRAKLLFRDTEVAIFKKVYGEVEREIQTFRTTLHKKLLQMPSPLEEKKKLIRHLVDLEYPGNPAWECIKTQQQWLLGILSSCKDNHTAREHDEVEYGPVSQRLNSSLANQRLFGSSALPPALIITPELKPKSVGPQSSTDQPVKLKTPQRVLFVEDLSQLITEHFPAFSRLGIAYFQGQLLRKDKELESRKAQTEQQQNLLSFNQMIIQVIRLYCNLVRRAFLPNSLESFEISQQLDYGEWTLETTDLPSAWLPQCVRTVRHCAETLNNDLSSESEPTSMLQSLVFDLRTDTMKTILRQAIDDVNRLHLKETWTLDTNDASGSITQLPTLFEHNVNEAINHLNEIVIRLKPGETDIFNDRTTQEEATALCVELVKGYVKTLEKCAFDETNLPNCTKEINGADSKLADDVLPLKKRLIITLSNCHHSLEKVLPRIMETLDKHGYHETQKVMRYGETAFDALDDSLFDKYIVLKVEPIIGGMEQKMYDGNFDWATCREPMVVRDYIKDTISQIVEVHAEVYSVLSVEFIPRVLAHLVAAIVDELYRLILSIKTLNKHGALQARIDLQAFLLATRHCLTLEAKTNLQEAIDVIPQSKNADQKMEKILNNFRQRAKLNLLALEQLRL